MGWLLRGCGSVIANLVDPNVNPLLKFLIAWWSGPLRLSRLICLEIISDEEVEFDSSAGSFASSTYQSKNSIESIKKFYSETLPQMGWDLTEFSNHSSTFKRENQTLRIEFSKSQKQTLAVFILTS